MVGKLLARQQQYLQQLVEKRKLEKEKEDAENAAAKQLMLKVPPLLPCWRAVLVLAEGGKRDKKTDIRK